MKTEFNTISDIYHWVGAVTRPRGPNRASEAYRRGHNEYYKWRIERKEKSSRPDNPYPDGSEEHDDYSWGAYECRDDCQMIEMGR